MALLACEGGELFNLVPVIRSGIALTKRRLLREPTVCRMFFLTLVFSCQQPAGEWKVWQLTHSEFLDGWEQFGFDVPNQQAVLVLAGDKLFESETLCGLVRFEQLF